MTDRDPTAGMLGHGDALVGDLPANDPRRAKIAADMARERAAMGPAADRCAPDAGPVLALRRNRPRAEGETMIARRIIDAMNADNDTFFEVSPDTFAYLDTLCDAVAAEGIVWDEGHDLDGPIWRAAAGEQTETAEYFAACPTWPRLDDALNAIFDGEPVDVSP